MMRNLTESEKQRIIRDVKKEFPREGVLRDLHIQRALTTSGMTLNEYLEQVGRIAKEGDARVRR